MAPSWPSNDSTATAVPPRLVHIDTPIIERESHLVGPLMTVLTPQPHRLSPNVIEHFYRGGERIAALRGAESRSSRGEPLRRPEEWLASTVTRWGTDDSGLTELDGFGMLTELIAADPDGWLGADHVARWGSSTALLVKLLDAGQRLPVHVHPNRRFATDHLGCPFGKTEAWVVLDAPAGGGTVFVGTTRPVRRERVGRAGRGQAVDAMLELLHPIQSTPATASSCRRRHRTASMPACSSSSCRSRPTSPCCWSGTGSTSTGEPMVISASASTWLSTPCAQTRSAASDVDRLVRRARRRAPATARPLLPAGADPYFRAWAVGTSAAAVTVQAAFSVVIVTDGAGTLRWAGGQLDGQQRRRPRGPVRRRAR